MTSEYQLLSRPRHTRSKCRRALQLQRIRLLSRQETLFSAVVSSSLRWRQAATHGMFPTRRQGRTLPWGRPMNATSKQATYEESTCRRRDSAGVYSTRKKQACLHKKNPEKPGQKRLVTSQIWDATAADRARPHSG